MFYILHNNLNYSAIIFINSSIYPDHPDPDVLISVVDPEPFDADPDPTFPNDVDPDPVPAFSLLSYFTFFYLELGNDGDDLQLLSITVLIPVSNII